MKPKNFHNVLMLATATAALVACGGGGSSSPSSYNIEGTAAYGAAFPAGSVIAIVDATGTEVGKINLTGSDGTYKVTIPSTAKAPLIITATADDLPSMVSVSPELQDARVNVTPITNLIASRLSPSGDPSKLAEAVKANPSVANTEQLTSKKNEVLDILKPVLDALGDKTDPVSGNFSANGQGHDQLLDAIKIDIVPSSATTANITVAVKQAQSQDTQPVEISFTSNAANKPSLPTIDKATLPQQGLSVKIADLLARMTACYSLPVADRINAGGTTAADIKAPECKSIFLDNDPSKYKSNSYLVSSSGHYTGIFSSSDAAKSVTFSLPTYQYTVKNDGNTDPAKAMTGDVVFTAKWVDAAGNTSVDEYQARPDASGKLYMTGNLSNIDATVSPRGEFREYVHANLSSKTYYNTGYDVYVNSKHPYAKIVVTAPNGKTMTLKKSTGLSYYTLVKDSGVQTSTSTVRLAGQYLDLSNSSSPRIFDSGIFWINSPDVTGADKDWTEDEIKAIGNQGTWKFDLYTNVADTNSVGTTYRRTLQRAPTIAETRQLSWPTLVSAVKTDLISKSTAGYQTMTDAPYAMVGPNNGDAWVVQSGGFAPTNFKVYGNDPLNSYQVFDDIVTFGSTKRSTTLKCSAGTGDLHCSTSTAGNFKTGVRIYQLQFNGRDIRRVLQTYSIKFQSQ